MPTRSWSHSCRRRKSPERPSTVRNPYWVDGNHWISKGTPGNRTVSRLKGHGRTSSTSPSALPLDRANERQESEGPRRVARHRVRANRLLGHFRSGPPRPVGTISRSRAAGKTCSPEPSSPEPGSSEPGSLAPVAWSHSKPSGNLLGFAVLRPITLGTFMLLKTSIRFLALATALLTTCAGARARSTDQKYPDWSGQ